MGDNEHYQIRKRLHDDLKHYAFKCLKIRTKSGSIEPFTFNKAQLYTHEQLEKQLRETGKVRALILKGRQQGMSTYIGARFYHKVTFTFGLQAFILTHALHATDNLFKMAKRFFEHTPKAVRPEVSTSNSKELVFGSLDSGYKLGTAENKNVGRSSTIQLLHGSEVAFWNNAADHATGVMQAIPNSSKTEVIMESTANGVGNYFHQQWQLAEAKQSEFIAIFVPWYWQDEYARIIDDEEFAATAQEEDLKHQYGLTDEQLSWRRMKIGELSVNGVDGTKSFMQEYPCNATEAFQLTGEDSFINSDIVMKARKFEAEKYGPLVLGVDPARFGDDRTSIIRRQGRVAYGLESYTKKDTMEVVGIVHSIIIKEKPVKVFVDVGGLGAGVVDRLRELVGGDIIVSVNAGSTPLDARRYINKRAEMWALCKEWLMDEAGCQIPDKDSLHADLAGIRYKVDSNSRLVMEQKAEMKKRGVRSPDESDALCLVAGTLIRTPLGMVPIEKLIVGDEVITPFGNTKIMKTWVSETDLLTTAKFSNGSALCGKGAHKVFNWNTGECALDALSFTFKMEPYSKWRMLKWKMLNALCMKGRSFEFKALVDTINRTIGMRSTAFYIVVCGQIITAIFQKVITFITKMETGVIMIFPILRPCLGLSIKDNICSKDFQIQNTESKIGKIWIRLFSRPQNGISQKLGSHGTNSMESAHGRTGCQKNVFAKCAQKNLKDSLMPNFALNRAGKKDAMLSRRLSLRHAFGVIKIFWQTNIAKLSVVPVCVQTERGLPTKVYNLTLLHHNAYYANDILVFNCLTFAQPLLHEKGRNKILDALGTSFDKQLTARDYLRQ